MQNKESFHYTYSAKEQEEIKKIRERYLTEPKGKEIDKMEELRALDARVTQKGTMVALWFGIVGVLLMGTGMSFIMTELGEYFGLLSNVSFVMGLIFGTMGAIFVIVAYPLYKRIIKKERERIAPQIISLTDELLK